MDSKNNYRGYIKLTTDNQNANSLLDLRDTNDVVAEAENKFVNSVQAFRMTALHYIKDISESEH